MGAPRRPSPRRPSRAGSLSLINHFAGDVLSGPEATAAAVRALFAHRGNTLYDPQVTQLEHGLQAAALARAEAPDDPELIAAALLHDVGHLVLDEHNAAADFHEEDRAHEVAGHAFLNSRFSERVAAISLHHVAAKRYLCGAGRTQPRPPRCAA